MEKNKTFTSISDRIKYKRDITIFLTNPKITSYELRQTIKNVVCICK